MISSRKINDYRSDSSTTHPGLANPFSTMLVPSYSDCRMLLPSLVQRSMHWHHHYHYEYHYHYYCYYYP